MRELSCDPHHLAAQWRAILEPPDLLCQVFRGRDTEIRGEHSVAHARVMIAHFLLGQVLRSNAVYHVDICEFGHDHQVVHIEYHLGAPASGGIHGGRNSLVPRRPPNHERIRGFDFFQPGGDFLHTHPGCEGAERRRGRGRARDTIAVAGRIGLARYVYEAESTRIYHVRLGPDRRVRGRRRRRQIGIREGRIGLARYGYEAECTGVQQVLLGPHRRVRGRRRCRTIGIRAGRDDRSQPLLSFPQLAGQLHR